MAPETQPTSRPRRPKVVEGNDLLYHFLQKTLLEEDADQFQALTARLVVALGVWLPPDAYQRYPVLVPYAVRDPTCRGNKKRGLPDQWGAPNEAGVFRDDNSLVKGIPRSLEVVNPRNPLLHRRRLGTSFVAAHVWRKLSDGTDAPRNRATYSFVPNVVWLPSQLAKLSDREGSFVQTFLQALSVKIYRSEPLTAGMQMLVSPIWELLPERPETREMTLPNVDDLNYFRFDDRWLKRRVQALESVVRALAETGQGKPLLTKVISTRYGQGLSSVAPAAAGELHKKLSAYLDAVS